MNKRIIHTKKAPQPKASYSQAINVGDFLFISGQGPIDPHNGLITSEDVEKQTIQVLKNIESILQSEGLDFEDVVKVSIFLRDMKDYEKVNNIYNNYFQKNPPARTTIQATPPGNIKIEIDAIAYYQRSRKNES